jgi:hypothetical protein
VDVLAAQEDVAQDLLVGDVGEDPQLDLRVVDEIRQLPGSAMKQRGSRGRSRCDRDVLQVRVDRGPAGRWRR